MSLPFEHCGIVNDTICNDNVYGLTYTLNDGRYIECPVSGGVWLNDKQVNGTCDKPYNNIIEALKIYLNKVHSK